MSSLRKAKFLPIASLAPRLQADANPRFVSACTILLLGWNDEISRSAGLGELKTTTTSWSGADSSDASDFRASARSSPARSVGMITDTPGDSAMRIVYAFEGRNENDKHEDTKTPGQISLCLSVFVFIFFLFFLSDSFHSLLSTYA